MKRTLTLSSGLFFKRFNQESWSIIIEVSYNELSPLIMELQMIEYSLAQSITLNSPKTQESMSISLSQTNESEITQDGSKFNVTLTLREIELVTSYLLQYYRDYSASVNHIDIEVVHKGTLGKDATLVIKASDANEPMTEEEARKMLGM